jgi:hypothetical protein
LYILVPYKDFTDTDEHDTFDWIALSLLGTFEPQVGVSSLADQQKYAPISRPTTY